MTALARRVFQMRRASLSRRKHKAGAASPTVLALCAVRGHNDPTIVPEPIHTEVKHIDNHSAVIGNERITALAGAVLLLLIAAELVSTLDLRALMSAHVFIGVLLTGPLIVKLGSIGFRFLRYYTGTPAFVQKGPPRLALRILAPLLIVTTLVLIGSGIGLVVVGPARPEPLLAVHNISVVIWLPMVAIHVLAHIRRVLPLVADDWQRPAAQQAAGRERRLGVNLTALIAAALAAAILVPNAAPWFDWIKATQTVPAPLIVGLVIAALAVLVIRPLRWGSRA